MLDYHESIRGRGFFLDSLHLNATGASRFSRRFFEDLGRVLEADGRDLDYEVKGQLDGPARGAQEGGRAVDVDVSRG